MSKLRIFQGDTTILDLSASQGGESSNLAGCSFWFTAKSSKELPDFSAEIRKTLGNGITIVDADAGTFSVEITPADTENLEFNGEETLKLFYDIQMRNQIDQVFTLVAGILTVVADVTNDVADRVNISLTKTSDARISVTHSIEISSDAQIQ